MASNFRFRIAGLSFENIREMENVTLEFESNAINPLLMRNGYGKTTMLTLLRWMFTGAIPPQSGSNWPQYKRDFGGDTSESKVVLKLKISDDDDVLRDWELTMWFNHNEGDCGFETYSSEVGGRQAGWHLPPAFRSRFYDRPKFTELFIFDGETAKELTSGQGRNQIENAILELTGLVHVKDMSMEGGVIDAHRNAEFKKAAINDPENAAAKYINWKSQVDDHVATQVERERKTKAQLSVHEKKLEGIKKQIDGLADNEAAQKALDAEQKKLRDMQNNRKNLAKELLTNLGNPANIGGTFWGNTTRLHSQLARAKVPEGVGRQFFHDILEEDDCVCGNPWDDEMKAHINSRIDRYLADDIMTVVKSMQQHVSESHMHTVDLSESAEEITDTGLAISEINDEINRIKRTFNEETQKELNRLEGLADELESKISDCNDLLDEINQTDPTIIQTRNYIKGALKDDGEPLLQFTRVKNCINLFTLKKVQRALQKKLEELTPLKRLSEGADLAKDVFNDALKESMTVLRAKVEEDTNDLLAQIASTGGTISVRFMENRIAFIQETGRVQDGANQGAILSGAYCFVSALASLGSMEPVLVADSPVTGMDSFTTEGWVNAIWPFFKQAVFIMTPGERGIILSGPQGIGRAGLEALDHFAVVKRSDEDMATGVPQTGIMEVHAGREVFFNYAMALQEVNQ
jgi:DNA sulfur modification protein DndD